MKCISVKCKCEANKTVETLWGKKDVVGFCDTHSPNWLINAKVGEYSPKTNMMGIVKSWYKRIS